LRQQHLAHGGDDFLAGQRIASPRSQHRVEDERDFRVVADDLAIASTFSTLPIRPILKAATGMSSSTVRACCSSSSAATGCIATTPEVSARQRSERAQRVAAEAGQGQQVGLDAGAAGGSLAAKTRTCGRLAETMGMGGCGAVSGRGLESAIYPNTLYCRGILAYA
jgi:hypothetical protein